MTEDEFDNNHEAISEETSETDEMSEFGNNDMDIEPNDRYED